MENSIATASKNMLRIRAREYGHYAYRAGQKLLGDRPSGPIRSTLLYPEFTDPVELGDALNRLAWYLPSDAAEEDAVVYLAADAETFDTARDRTPASQAGYELAHCPVERVGSERAGELASTVDRLLLWDKTARVSPVALRNLRRVEIVDPSYYSAIEPNMWERVVDDLLVDQGGQSKERFEELEAKASRADEAFVFATGPSLSDVKTFDIPEDALTIICNSAVRDTELLEHVDPDVLTFGDPVFHYGPSRYAAEFRRDAVEVLRSYDCVGVIPPCYRSLLTGHYGPLDLVGIQPEPLGRTHLPDANDLRVWATGNIMTVYMLPLAMALTDHVYVAGADGRKEDESYFWEHNDDAQYDDELMETVATCHPAFFRDRIYEDYYDRHVETLTEMIEFGEERGVEFETITHSYVPYLAERRVDYEDRRASTSNRED